MGRGRGQGHFSLAAIYCITTWCFAPKGLRKTTNCMLYVRVQSRFEESDCEMTSRGWMLEVCAMFVRRVLRVHSRLHSGNMTNSLTPEPRRCIEQSCVTEAEVT